MRFICFSVCVLIFSAQSWAQGDRTSSKEMTFGGISADEIRQKVEAQKAKDRDMLQKAKEEDAAQQQKRYERLDALIERHQRDQRSSEEMRQEGKSKDQDVLYIRMLEFHDKDGDGMVDHGVSKHHGSELERAFSPEAVLEGKKLKVYKYFEAHEFTNIEGQKIKHLQRKMRQEQEKKAELIGHKYADEVIRSVTTESQRPITDLLEDSIRDLHQKAEEHSQDALHFQRVKRLEKYQDLKQKRREEKIKSAFVVDNTVVNGAHEAKTTYESAADREANLQAAKRALDKYKKSHPECLKAQWNCFVDEKGVIRAEKLSDSKRVGGQIEDTQEYEAQSQILMLKGGESFMNRLPGELEDMTFEQKRMLQEERQKYQKRKASLKTLIEKKRKAKIVKGKVVETQEATGEKATLEKIEKLDKPSAFIKPEAAGKKGEIDLKKLQKQKGKGVFKTLDY